MGVTLVGRFLGADGGQARFAADLNATVAWGDARYRELRALFTQAAPRLGIPAPPMPDPPPFRDPGITTVDLAGFGAVLFTGGFRPDYRSWLPWPEAFDEQGFPIQRNGASLVVPGLHFVGVHFLRTRASSILFGMGRDAAVVARSVAESLGGQGSGGGASS
jgi:putative flavoprotein involved in K+ transport